MNIYTKAAVNINLTNIYGKCPYDMKLSNYMIRHKEKNWKGVTSLTTNCSAVDSFIRNWRKIPERGMFMEPYV